MTKYTTSGVITPKKKMGGLWFFSLAALDGYLKEVAQRAQQRNRPSLRHHPEYERNAALLDECFKAGMTINEISRRFEEYGVTDQAIWSLLKNRGYDLSARNKEKKKQKEEQKERESRPWYYEWLCRECAVREITFEKDKKRYCFILNGIACLITAQRSPPARLSGRGKRSPHSLVHIPIFSAVCNDAQMWIVIREINGMVEPFIIPQLSVETKTRKRLSFPMSRTVFHRSGQTASWSQWRDYLNAWHYLKKENTTIESGQF